jgi:hypothetical protein
MNVGISALRPRCAATLLLSFFVALVGATVTCPSQCVQPAIRTFGPFPPTPGTHPSLANPLDASGHESVLKIVTMGDSVVWGNGNIPENKFAIKVAHHMADATGRSVLVVAYAHSGARLKTYTEKNSLVPTDGAVYQSDLNSQRPTTTEQATCAASRDSDAEIVLLDGCINETGATKIALPFPLNWTPQSKIQQLAYEGCSEPMKELLEEVDNAFKKATVLVLNYYQIVTSDSKPLEESLQPGAAAKSLNSGTSPADAEELRKEQEKLLSMSRQRQDLLIVQQENALSALQSWQANSIVFLNTSEGCFKWAVAGVDGALPPPLPAKLSDAILSGPTCPLATAPAPQRASDSPRFFLVTVDNKPEFGYGAPQTHEWRLGSDDMYDARALLCMKHYSGNPFAEEECKINAVAHPNVVGAQAYTYQINAVLDKAWSRTPSTP